ncbi:MAG: hypothetical protein R8M38_05845 [Mariprofundaceae bacterium]
MLESSAMDREVYELLTLVFDLLLMASMAALWWLWWKSANRQKQVEKLLLSATQQLDEATNNLQKAYALMPRNEAQKPKHPVVKKEAPTPQPTKKYAKDTDQDATDGDQLNKILRLRREGSTPETIAEQLTLPIAQVRLLLKLHEKN